MEALTFDEDNQMRTIRCLLLVSFAVTGCAAPSIKPASSFSSVPVTATVEKVCVECKEALLVDRTILRWDELTVHIDAPADYSGKRISVDVRVENPAQRQKYLAGSVIEFSATASTIAQRRVQLTVENLGR